jgi:predicted deacetylase
MCSDAERALPPRLLVSVHDVTPALESGVRTLWSLCHGHGLTPALLVVPEWHGRWPLERAPAFVAWLRARAAEGAEILLHGERHDEVGSPRTLGAALRAVGRTVREGEFLTLDRAGADARIARGLARLRALGLEPIGFVPPAWLAREATHDAVRAQGLAVSEDAAAVRLHRQDRRVAAPAVRWSGRTPVRAHLSRAVASARWRVHRSSPLVRLALHPQDLEHPVTARSVAREVARWAWHGSAVRYGDL